jgi:putative tricarboxylic transport membrane protein
MTAPERLGDAPGVQTLVEQGFDVTFVNWRGFFAAPGLPEDQKAAYIKVLGDMYAKSEWEDVRKRNGWVNIFLPGDEFVTFLEKQEEVILGLMTELGFL